MINKKNEENDFTVRFPEEYFINWIKTEGINDGMILENQKIVLKEIDLSGGYINIYASLLNRLDS
jgi:hypothetical protein